MAPLISIVVPVYNTAEYIEQCVRSILLQDFTLLELVLVDDGSTDGSSGLCDEFATADERVKVIHQENSGVSVARNRGFDVVVRLTDPGSAGNSHGVFSGIGQRLFHHHVDPAHEDLGDNDSVKRVLAVHKDKVGFEIEKITVILKHAGEPTLLLTELQVHGAAGAFKIFRLYHRLDIRGTDPFHALRHGQKRLDLIQNVHVSEAHQTNAIFLHNIHLICDQFPSAQKVVCSGTMLFVLIASGMVHMMSTTCLACSGGKPTGRSSSMAWIRS